MSTSACYMEEDIVDTRKRKAVDESRQSSKRTNVIEIHDCPVCDKSVHKGIKTMHRGVIASCGHVFCTKCYVSALKRTMSGHVESCQQCPVCFVKWDKPTKLQFLK